MALRWLVRPKTYVDSVKLMRVSDELSRLPGVERAAASMATPLNLELLAADGLLPPALALSPDDLLITARGVEEAAEAALAAVDGLLAVRATPSVAAREPAPSLEEAADGSAANLAVIAVPGERAGVEAFAALRAGLHVFLFSDNVPLELEIELKRLAEEQDLLLMGPDCGTALLGGIGLGFANRVRPGPVGIVGASGTGIQQVCTLLDAAGIGVAQAIGTGGRDLSAAVGGSMTRRALRALDADPHVQVLVLLSKPPDRATAERLHHDLDALTTPVVACLLGESLPDTAHVQYVPTLTAAAEAVIARLAPQPGAAPLPAATRPGGHVYGYYTGGTLCSESAQLLDRAGVWHQLVDLGDDQYTRGRAHPIIDPRLRTGLLTELAQQPEAGAVLLDVILGDLAHPDPAGVLLPALEALRQGSNPEVVAVLIGTAADPQGLERQRQTLESVGVRVYASNAEAAKAAAALVGGTV